MRKTSVGRLLVYALLVCSCLGFAFFALHWGRLIRRVPELPEFRLPSQNCHQTLQEKVYNNKDSIITLSIEEFNALLSYHSFKPVGFFSFRRVRFVPKKDHGTFFIIGSGLFMRTVNAQIRVSQKNLELEKIKINSLIVPNYLIDRVFNYFVSVFATCQRPLLRDIFIDNQANLSFTQETISFLNR